MPTGLRMVRKQLIDQPLHFLWGAISQLPLLLAIAWHGELAQVHTIIAASLGAILMSMPRELVDQWPIVRKWDFVLDVCFFTLGGGVAAWLVMSYL